MLCVCCEMRWWASKDRGQNQQCSVCLPVRLRKHLSQTQTVWLQRLFEGAKMLNQVNGADCWVCIPRLHRKGKAIQELETRSFPKAQLWFSSGKLFCLILQALPSSRFNDLSLQLAFRSALMSLVAPEDIYTLLCRWWKDNNLLEGLW